MSNQIPFHIQEEIIKRLPVKKLIQFRSVSKAWKSLIDSSEFIAAHSGHHSHRQYLFVKYQDPANSKEQYVSFVDDDTFPQQRFVPTLPLSVQTLNLPTLVGSSHGLLCLYDNHPNLRTSMAVLWNPSIRKSIAVAVPNKLYFGRETVVGFGVCPVTNDPKIIIFTQSNWLCWHKTKINHPWKVEVYMMSCGKWRSLSSNLLSKSFRVTGPQVVIDRFIYWCALHKVPINGRLRTRNVIMSFNMTNENLGVVDLPDSLAYHLDSRLSISKVRESLAMLEYSHRVCVVWMMEDGVGKAFTKLYTIKAPHGRIRTLGFTKSGKPIMEVKDQFFGPGTLVVHDPNLAQFNNLEISGTGDSFFVNSYMETLLLHDRLDCSGN